MGLASAEGRPLGMPSWLRHSLASVHSGHAHRTTARKAVWAKGLHTKRTKYTDHSVTTPCTPTIADYTHYARK